MQVIEQNILNVTGPAVICHQVNCMGVMGIRTEVELPFKWEHVYDAYVAKKDWELGDCQIVMIDHEIPQYVANLAGQKTFGGDNETRVFQLETALRAARDFANANGLTLYVPYMMGCGLGGGDWDVVSKMIERTAPNAVICKLPE